MLFLPELILLLGALAIFLVSLGAPTVSTIRTMTIALAALVAAAALISLNQQGTLFFASYRVDFYSQLFKVLIALATLAILVFSGKTPGIKKDVRAVVEVAHSHNVAVKVIFENYYLTDEQKRTACELCEEAGADFVKTSSGFAGGGATLEDLQLMKDNVSEKVQVKAAGGVRDLKMALKVREIGCTRFGATRTETIMEECYKEKGEK